MRQIVLAESPKAQRLYPRILDELYKDAAEMRESIRNGIRDGVVIQQLKDLGHGQLWRPADSTSEPGEPPS